jgi:hypothetical protein
MKKKTSRSAKESCFANLSSLYVFGLQVLSKSSAMEAFPVRIPQAILTGRYDHRKRHDGDRGIRFQPRDDVSQAELESILSIFDKKTAF